MFKSGLRVYLPQCAHDFILTYFWNEPNKKPHLSERAGFYLGFYVKKAQRCGIPL